ncbi:MAG: hypothetical protein RI935_67 [Candidatus Parcubacteria bacterium]
MDSPSYLSVAVADESTLINYVVDGHIIVSHVHPFGYKNIEAEGMNQVAASKFIDGILYTLEFISLHDRVPTDVRLLSKRHSMWIGEVIEGTSYTQFFTRGAKVSVTLEKVKDTSLSYARHSQTIHSFKV